MMRTMVPFSRIFITGALLLVCIMVPAASSANDVDAGKKELQRIKKEMGEKKLGLQKADRKERSVLSELDAIDRGIQSGLQQLAEQKQKLVESEELLREVEQKNASVSSELATVKQYYAARLRALYKMGRSGYPAAIVLSDEPGSMIKRIKYLGAIAAQDRMLIAHYGNTVEQLTVRAAEIAEKKKDIAERQQAIEAKRGDLEAQRRKKSQVLGSVRKEKGVYEQTLRELEAASTDLWAMIKREEQSRAVVGRSSAQDRNRLAWPVEGQVLTRFGAQRHPQFGTTIFKRGIEIEAREGESIRAVESGQVAFADWYKGFGKLLILDHGNGFFTLYGNLSRIDPVKGNRVARGQVIGQAGETGSTKGAKLYFEIRRNGEAQDPLIWLAKR